MTRNMTLLQYLCILFISLSSCVGLDNGLSRTPAMGWNPYNAFNTDTTEEQYRAAAQKLVDTGLAALGYKYFNLDAGWQGTERTSSGEITWNATRFPSGIPSLASYVHDLGLKFGVYSDAGYYSCDFVGGAAHWLGSLGNETKDAATFASWGADYLKYDNCYAVNRTDFVDDYPPISLEPHYVAMRDALAATNRSILYSICEWGVQNPAQWAGSVGNSWRISNDIGPPPSWDSVFRIINQVVPITSSAGPGAWNDLDLLEVGNTGLTFAEQQSHFAFWAAVKSPLLISTDVTNMSDYALSILNNARIIDVNQDALGASIAFKKRYTNDSDVWAGPLSDGSTVAVILNWQNDSRPLTFYLPDIGFSEANATDVWTGQDLGRLNNSYTAPVDAHGSLVLKLSNTTSAPKPSFSYYPASSPNNTLSGAASTRQVNSSVTVVGYIGSGNGTLTFNDVDAGSQGGTKLLSVDYINGDYTFSNNDCSNCRNAYVSINGGNAEQVQMPISGQDWDTLFSGYLVSLSGFNPGDKNTIEFSNPSGWTPDIYRIGVASM